MPELFAEGIKSLNSLIWNLKPYSDDEASKIAANEDIPEIVARLLSIRGINPNDVHAFLYATLKENLPDPSALKDCQIAANKVANSIIHKKTIGIFGDYDVDGATSTSLLCRFLDTLNINTLFHIPERSEGYGPNIPALEQLTASGADLIITVDCGTSADSALNHISNKGIPVIVIDHHEPDPSHIPNVLALINPKRIDEPLNNPFRKMAAVGVVFMFIIALNRTLRTKGYYNTHKEPNLIECLDLVALGTVCDVVDLTGINRLLVKSGLKIIGKRTNLGLHTLIDAAGITSAITVHHLGFAIGPKINAGGRIGTSSLGTELLTTDDPDKATEIANTLCALNAERQEIEASILAESIEQIERETSPQSIAFAFNKNWHSGIIGIVAGRLKERYHLPAFVIGSGDDEAGILHGSCRSIHGVDIGSTIIDALANGIITKGGGHTMAAGFSLPAENIAKAKEFFSNHILTQINSQDTPIESTLDIDAVLGINALNPTLIKHLSLLGPFGEGNPEPIFAIKDVQLFFLGVRGQGHIACNIISFDGHSIKGIAFNAADTAMGHTIITSKGEKFHIAGRIHTNEFNGRVYTEFHILDAMLA